MLDSGLFIRKFSVPGSQVSEESLAARFTENWELGTENCCPSAIVAVFYRILSRLPPGSRGSEAAPRSARPDTEFPASVPLVWLTRTPAIPLGTITMPAEIKSGAQASITSATEVRQRALGPGLTQD